MADTDPVQHPNPTPDEPPPAEQLQPAGQAAVPTANQQELEVIILLPHGHDLRSPLFLSFSFFLLRNHEPFLTIQRGQSSAGNAIGG